MLPNVARGLGTTGKPRICLTHTDGIREAIEDKTVYHPESSDKEPSMHFAPSGTELVLRNLNRRVLSSLNQNLSVRLTRSFSVIGDDFRVFFEGNELEFRHRHIVPKLEYVLTYGPNALSAIDSTKTTVVPRNNTIQNGHKSYKVNGWIGLVSESGSLQEGDDNLNRIGVLVRGKMALENILDEFREGGLYTKYVIGELGASFLNATAEEDIATSSRQDFLQSDARVVALKEFVGGELKFLKSERAKYKEKTGTQRATSIPAIKAWYNCLGEDGQRAARTVFGKINQLDVDLDERKTLLKHGILAFEHLRHKDKLSELSKLSIESLDVAVQLFSDLDDIEATWYHQITRGRLGVIEKLSADVSDDVVEKIIQKHIYRHLWLLDPSWDRATETPHLERSVKVAFEEISGNLTEDEKRSRIDIRYKKSSGRHIIIELKRASRVVSHTELIGQTTKYVRALEKQIKNAGETGDIEVVCVVGQSLKEWDEPKHQQQSEAALSDLGIRVVLYQTLIKDAETAYASYLDQGEEKGRIQGLLDEIDAS